jgi:hypothetical protein
MTPREAVPGRDCRDCTLCCKLLAVEELAKPPLGWCPHCVAKAGCGIYQQRPTECRQFYCEYRLDGALGAHWKPSRCKIVVVLEEHTNSIVIHDDPARPQAWRREPYLSEIRQWADDGARSGRQVIVWQGDRKIVIAPRRHAPAAHFGQASV